MGFDNNTFTCIGNDTFEPCGKDEDFYVNQFCETLEQSL